MVSAEWLKRAELFDALNASQLNTLLSNSNVDAFQEGERIFRQGEKANRLYILMQGSVDLRVKTQEQIDIMASKIEKEGAVFGTASLTEPFLYNVTAICLQPSKVLTLDADYMKKTMEEDPKMGMEIMRKLAFIYFNRLNDMRTGVSNLLKIFKFKTP